MPSYFSKVQPSAFLNFLHNKKTRAGNIPSSCFFVMYYEGCKVSVTFYPARLAAFVFVEHDVEDFVVRYFHALAGQAAYVADAFVYVVGYKAVVAADADVVEGQHDGAVCRHRA